ncbi:reverse transcriptase domain-containing protein [Tanacetum coccineum]
MANLTDMLSKFVNSNTASTSVVERETEVTKDTVLPTNNGSTKDVQPPVVHVQSQVPNSKPVVDPVSALMPNLKPSIPYPSRRNDEKRREKANDQVEKFYKIIQDMSFEISLADALILMPKFASTLKALIRNKEKLSEMARTHLNEHCSAVILNKLPEKLGDPGKFLIPCDFPGMDECLALVDLGASINLMPLSVWKKLSLPELTPTCMTLELVDRSITKPIGIAEDVYLKVGKFKFPVDFVVVDFDADPRVPLILERSFLKTGPKTDKSSIDEPPEVELKDLPPHLEYEFLEGNNKLPIIIAKDLSVEEKSALIKVLKSHKRAIAWKLSDIKGINLEFYTHKILMEEDYKPAVQHQRRVNPKIHDVIKKEVEKLLDAGLIYPISDSPGFFHNLEQLRSVYGSLCPKISFAKKDSKARVLRWVLLLQEFDFNVIDTKGAENLAADHLSRLENPYENVLDPKEAKKLLTSSQLAIVDPPGDITVATTPPKSAKALPTNKHAPELFAQFINSLFADSVPSSYLSDRGTHFCNDQFAKRVMLNMDLLTSFTAYHPQTSRQVEVSNRGLKRILERTVGENHAS